MKVAVKIVKGVLDFIVITFILGFLGGATLRQENISYNPILVVSFGWVYLVVYLLDIFTEEEKKSKK